MLHIISNVTANPNTISSHTYCSDYSYSAITRAQSNEAYNCGYKGSEWSLKKEEHYQKCIKRKKQINDKEVTARYNLLNKCLIKKQSNNFIINKKDQSFKYKRHRIVTSIKKHHLPIINKNIDLSQYFEKYKKYSPCHSFHMEISLDKNVLNIRLYHSYSSYTMPDYGFLCFSSPTIYHTDILKFKKNDRWCLDTYTNIDENTDMYNEGIYEGNKIIYKLKEGVKFSISEVSGDYSHSNEPSDSKSENKTNFKAPKECLSLNKSLKLVFKDQPFD